MLSAITHYSQPSVLSAFQRTLRHGSLSREFPNHNIIPGDISKFLVKYVMPFKYEKRGKNKNIFFNISKLHENDKLYTRHQLLTGSYAGILIRISAYQFEKHEKLI